jgi:phosphoribosylformylglycinamidine cyclo-ligase
MGDQGVTYKDAGVDIDAGEEVVRRIGASVRTTHNDRVLADIGGFGGLYDASFLKEFNRPVLVSSVDSVGTKVKVAAAAGTYDGLGIDLVNHCVNDIAVCGAVPIYFLDYYATGRLVPDVAVSIVESFVAGCRENECALIGGETAEMPSIYADDDFDIAGMIVGVVEADGIVDGRDVAAGDLLIGLPSSGLHTNGFSLARKVLFPTFDPHDSVPALGSTVAEALLAPHRSYLGAIQATIGIDGVQGFAHITGGGIVGNTSRVVRDPRTLDIDWSAWERPAIFSLIQETGSVPENDMRRTFNCGVGLVVVVRPEAADNVLGNLSDLGEQPFVIGSVK